MCDHSRALTSIVLSVLLAGCIDTRTDGGGGGTFESSLFSKERAIAELSDSEAHLLCNEIVDHVNAQLSPDEWERATCTGSEGLDEPTPSQCEERVAQCLETHEWAGVDFSYSQRCTFHGPLSCTLTVEDVEACAQELASEMRRIASGTTCDYAGVGLSETVRFSPGCQAAYDSECGCVLAKLSGSSSADCP